MADDVNPALRSEYEAALAVLEPQIRGLNDLATVSISMDLKQEVARQIEIRGRRKMRIKAILDAFDLILELRTALERDGYPRIEDSRLPDNLFQELSGENSDLDAAASVFKPEGASELSVNLGAAAPKSPKEKS